MSKSIPKQARSKSSTSWRPENRSRIRKPSSTRSAMRQYLGRFRFQDNSLSSFAKKERGQIERFQKFVMKTPNGFCSVCLMVLYPEEQRFRNISDKEVLSCYAWNLEPITGGKSTKQYMVCKVHSKMAESRLPIYTYPGKVLKETQELNYRERSVLSPVKIITQITRKSTLASGRIGHYELSGSLWMTHNYEFAQMAYSGTLGLFFQRGDPASINKEKVRKAYAELQKTHPLLARYDLQPLVHSLVNYHIKENSKYIGIRSDPKKQWPNNMLFPEDNPNPQAADANFKDLYIGQDTNGKNIRKSHPSLLALIFPYLFPNCSGHYSMTAPDDENKRLPETHGGIAKSTLHKETLKGYTRLRLLMKDRRFSKDQLFLFFMLDMIERNNIDTYNRLVVSTKGRGDLRQKDVIDATTNTYNKNIVSKVPYTVRSSLAYKRKNYLNLRTIFSNLSAPQLFLTFSCDDFSTDFKNATATENPWEDPVLFANHFKRKWNHFFSKYILGHFADMIGGINDYSWVLEVQDRGAPHIHCVLWTKETVEELIRRNIVCCKILPKHSYQDPFLHNLVLKHQIHECNPVYCKLMDNNKCRFGYPKEPAPKTEFVEDTCIYERGVGDMNVNNYNPYLLAVWRANMDIQYNKGEAAVRYLAKYMAKNEADSVIEVAKKGAGFFKMPNEKNSKEHFKRRVVGAIEAVYDIMGWHKHQSSRSVTFINTNLPNDDRRLLKPNIKDIKSNSKEIFNLTHVEKYEKRTGAKELTLPQFFCFYREAAPKDEKEEDLINEENGETGENEESEGYESVDPSEESENNDNDNYFQTRSFYEKPLQKFVYSGNTTYVLRKKESFWRTFNQSEVNGESYYYQQIVTKKSIYKNTFEKMKGEHRTWKDYFEYLINIPEESGGIILDDEIRISSVEGLENISDFERGRDVTAAELDVMLRNANNYQRGVYEKVIEELKTNTVAFVSGAAGTGKSFLLRMFERHYKIQDCKVYKLAPTGVAAHNVNGMTIHRFFGMGNSANAPNYVKLDALVKIYPKIVLLIDEYSMISNKLLDTMNDALVQTTNRLVGMGGIKTIFFGDLAQLLPIDLEEGGAIWKSGIYNYAPKYTLHTAVRQTDSELVRILNKVRLCNFDEEVIKFINKRTIAKRDIPSSCLRLYTTRVKVDSANEKEFKVLDGETWTLTAFDTFTGNNRKSAYLVLKKETRLLRNLILKLNMPVMLIHNLHISRGWVNGTIAFIEDIQDDNILLRKVDKEDKEDSIWVQRISRSVPGTSYVRSQYPIVPAFATTIHKAQSLTIDSVAIHLDNMLSHGQLYVAMSRVRKCEDLFFFGSELPLKIKRKFGSHLDAIDIIEFYDSNRPQI